MPQTPFASAGAVNYLFSRRAGQGKAASVGVGHTKCLKRQSAKIHRRLGKFLVAEACALDLETDDDAHIQFVFQSPCYYCPECGEQYIHALDMEDCLREHVDRRIEARFEQSYFDWIEAEMAEDMLNWRHEKACAEDARNP